MKTLRTCHHCEGRRELVPSVDCLDCSGDGKVHSLCGKPAVDCECPSDEPERCRECGKLAVACECRE